MLHSNEFHELVAKLSEIQPSDVAPDKRDQIAETLAEAGIYPKEKTEVFNDFINRVATLGRSQPSPDRARTLSDIVAEFDLSNNQYDFSDDETARFDRMLQAVSHENHDKLSTE